MHAAPDFVDRIYEAAIVAEQWQGVLDELCNLSEAAGAALLAFGAGSIRGLSTASYQPIVSDFLARGRDYANVRPERSLRHFPMGFAFDLEVCTLEELAVDPVYVNFYRPHGYAWSAGTVIPLPTSELLVFDLGREAGRLPFDRDAITPLDHYRPHLARAALLSHRLGLRTAQAMSRAMELIGLPAAVLSPGGRVLAANPLLEALSPRIRIRSFDRIGLASPAADQMLATALATIGRNDRAAVQSIAVSAIEDGPALVVHVVPVRRSALDIFTSAAALLIVTPVTMPDAPMVDVLVALFDLTPAEARVARGIATGDSVAAIASRYGLRRETVRTQLKAVMSKTGTTRQSQLALLLSGRQAIGSAR